MGWIFLDFSVCGDFLGAMSAHEGWDDTWQELQVWNWKLGIRWLVSRLSFLPPNNINVDPL